MRTDRGTASQSSQDSSEPTQLNRVDTTRFVGRVARAFHFAQERGGTLQLRLSPPELGSLRLELTVKDGALTASLETETHSARRLLLDHLPALRDRLADQNIRVERFDVNVGRDGQQGQSSASSQQHAQQQQQSQEPTRQRQRTSKPSVAQEVTRTTSARPHHVGSTGINTIV